MQPHYTAPRFTVEEARQAAGEAIGGFAKRALDWHRLSPEDQLEWLPEHGAIAVGVGLGKSTRIRHVLAGGDLAIAAIKAVGGYIAAAKAGGSPHRALVAVPMHKLGSAFFTELRRLGVNAAQLRGRDAPDPAHPDYDDLSVPRDRKTKMCVNQEAVSDAITLHQNVQSSVCGTGKAGDPSCPFFGSCSYQRDLVACVDADVIICANQSAFSQLPSGVGDDIGLTIIDEAFWQSGLRVNRTLALERLADEPLSHPCRKRIHIAGDRLARMVPDEEATNDLHVISAKAQAAIAQMGDGGPFVSRAAVIAAGLTADDCAVAEGLEWRRMEQGIILPGMDPADRKAAVAAHNGNAVIPKRVALWSALGGLLGGEQTHSGRLQTRTHTDDNGTYRQILLHTRSDIRKSIIEMPVLVLDATLPLDVVREYLPRVKMLADIQATAPCMVVHQILGGWGLTSLASSTSASTEENKRRLDKLAELVDFVRLNCQSDSLVITHQAIEHYFVGIPGVRTAHHGAIVGLDDYAHVKTLFVIGVPFADVKDLVLQARALTGRPIVHENSHLESRGALMADGTGRAMEMRAYADPDLEALRGAITDVAIVQEIGRGRGVNRAAVDPLAVFALANVVLPLPLTSLSRWEDVRPNVLERMLARNGMLFSPTDAAAVYPDLFPARSGGGSSVAAAGKAINRAQKEGANGHFPIKETIIGKCPVAPATNDHPDRREVSYRLGRGDHFRRATFTVAQLPDARGWLESKLGPLDHYTETVPHRTMDSFPEAPVAPPAHAASLGVRLWLQSTEVVPHIRMLLEREGTGRGRVVLIPRLESARDIEIVIPGGFNVTPRLAQALKALPNVERVDDIRQLQ